MDITADHYYCGVELPHRETPFGENRNVQPTSEKGQKKAGKKEKVTLNDVEYVREVDNALSSITRWYFFFFSHSL